MITLQFHRYPGSRTWILSFDLFTVSTRTDDSEKKNAHAFSIIIRGSSLSFENGARRDLPKMGSPWGSVTIFGL